MKYPEKANAYRHNVDSNCLRRMGAIDNWHRVSFWDDENVLNLIVPNGFTILRIY